MKSHVALAFHTLLFGRHYTVPSYAIRKKSESSWTVAQQFYEMGDIWGLAFSKGGWILILVALCVVEGQSPFHTSMICQLSQLQILGYGKSQNLRANSIPQWESHSESGLTTSTVIGPFFFKEMCDSGFEADKWQVHHMLQDRIISSLADKQLLESRTFMQDGALNHIVRQVKDLFHRSFDDDCVLSSQFHYVWPPKSPDLNPFHYWFWDYLKLQLYRYWLSSVEILKENIRR